MTPTTKHVHKVKRLKYKSGNAIFFCTLPDCQYKTNVALALGKRTICWRCGEEFIMNEYTLRLAKPHCDNCHKPKKDIIPFHNQTAIAEVWKEPSLAERLQQTIQQAQPKEEEEEI